MHNPNKQTADGLTKKSLSTFNEPESNRIFTTHKRGISSLSVSISPPKPKFYSREHNIMLLKRTIKRNHRRSEYDITKQQKNKSIGEINFPNNENGQGQGNISYSKVNVINIMNCSTTTTPKLKSNYCKKITLTNVQKYYQLCLQKVKSITNNTQNSQKKNKLSESPIMNSQNITTNPILQQFYTQIQEKNNSSRPTTPLKRQKSRQSKQIIKSTSFNNCPNTFSKSINLLHSKKQMENLFELECSNIAKLVEKNIVERCQNKECMSNRLHLKQQLPRRGSKSSQYNRNRDLLFPTSNQDSPGGTNSRYFEGKKQYIINGWEANDNIDNVADEAF